MKQQQLYDECVKSDISIGKVVCNIMFLLGMNAVGKNTLLEMIISNIFMYKFCGFCPDKSVLTSDFNGLFFNSPSNSDRNLEEGFSSYTKEKT